MSKSKNQKNSRQLKNKVLAFLEYNPSRTYNYKQVAKAIGELGQSRRKKINQILIELALENKIIEKKRGSYCSPQKESLIEGQIQFNKKGPTTLIGEHIDKEIIISQTNLNHALPNDKVKVNIYAKKRNYFEGEVVEVLQRAKETFVGILEISEHYAFLVPDNAQMPYDIFIPQSHIRKAKNGNKVIVKIIDWPEKAKNPIGKVVEVLGEPGEHFTEMHAILASFDLPEKFPKPVESAANEINQTISKSEIKKRLDLRDTFTITIDPEDAKDFDDAISIKKLPNNNWEIGVHIADVSHYVTPNSKIDKEAYIRATSIYMVDRVVPMLPEILSNKVCSLRPNEEKLTYSVIFEINNDATVVKYQIAKTVIKSNHRLTYEQAQEMIETQQGTISEQIITLNNIAQKLKQQRFKKGSINFDRKEMKFELDKDMKPIGVKFRESKEAHQLIEEYMLLANQTVASHIHKLNPEKAKTFVYRIHDTPNPEKLHNLSAFVKRFGYNIDTNKKDKISQTLNNMVIDSKGKPYQNIIETITVRAMAKAIYSTYNIGHYGLGFENYTHFTSPIRRYPDLLVHRLLFSYIQGGKSVQQAKLEERCNHCSDMEQKAAQAERASIKYKQVEYMEQFLGDDFVGIISGVTSWGIYVEIEENGCEGMISLQSLDDDYYIYNEAELAIIGKRRGLKYQLGDEVMIKVAGTNLLKKQLDFELIKKIKAQNIY